MAAHNVVRVRVRVRARLRPLGGLYCRGPPAGAVPWSEGGKDGGKVRVSIGCNRRVVDIPQGQCGGLKGGEGRGSIGCVWWSEGR